MYKNPVPRAGVVVATVILLIAELLLLAAGVAFLAIELGVEEPSSLTSAIALLVLAIIATLWVGAVAIGVWRGAAWSRAGGVVWQILQFAVGIGAIQGPDAQPLWGWPLIVASIAGVVVLLSRPVSGWTQLDRQSAPHDDLG